MPSLGIWKGKHWNTGENTRFKPITLWKVWSLWPFKTFWMFRHFFEMSGAATVCVCMRERVYQSLFFPPSLSLSLYLSHRYSFTVLTSNMGIEMSPLYIRAAWPWQTLTFFLQHHPTCLSGETPGNVYNPDISTWQCIWQEQIMQFICKNLFECKSILSPLKVIVHNDKCSDYN